MSNVKALTINIILLINKKNKMNELKTKLSLKVKIPSRAIPAPSSPASRHLNECTHITDNIYISGYKTSIDYSFLKSNNFTHIINCAGGSQTFNPIYFEDFSYLTLELRDDCTSDIEKVVEEFLTFMKENSSNSQNKILIHCSEGISRAPALLCSYLMWKKRLCFNEALQMIKEKRSCVEINLSFMFQLENLTPKLIEVLA